MSKLAINGGEKTRTQSWPSWPIWDQCEINAVTEVIESGHWGRLYAGEASRCYQLEEQFAAYQDARYGVAVTNGTAALEIALQAVGVDIGDEVILSPYTFVASATSILRLKAVPVFVDCEPDTRNIDPDLIEAAITDRTKAIMPVHFGGRACDMQHILDIASRHGLAVLEDAAHGWGATWNGRKVGAIGDIGTISFQASKHMTAGEGGMVLTNDEELAEKAFSYHHIGRLPGRPFYEHHECASNYRMNELTAAVLLCQLTRLEAQSQRRHENGLYLDEKLGAIPGLKPLGSKDYMTRIIRHCPAMFYDEEAVGVPRDRFIEALNAEGIPCSIGYPHPLYRNPLFTEKRFGRAAEIVDYPDYGSMNLPHSEQLCLNQVWIANNALLAEPEEMDDIVAAFLKIVESAEELV